MAGYINDDIDWWRNDGGSPPVWTRVIIDDSINGAATVHAADLDGDGDVDITGSAWDGGKLKWWENLDGDGASWQKRTIDDGLPWASGAFAADIDLDGDLDPIATSVLGDEVAWYEIVEFQAAGELTGTVLDLGTTPTSLAVDSDARLPEATSQTVELRCGEDSEDLGPWTHTLTAPGTIATALGRYVQYRWLPRTTDARVSPRLDEIRFSWSPRSSAVPRGAGETTGWGPAPMRWLGPSITRGAVAFEVPEATVARIEIFGVAGRRLHPADRRLLGPGTHQLDLSFLSAGSYLIRAVTDKQTIGFRVTVLP